LVVLSSAPASAAFVTSVSGDAAIIAPPADATPGALQSDGYLVWDESSVTLASDFDVDHDGTAGSYAGNNDFSLLGTTLAAGTKVNSSIIHLDPPTDVVSLQAVITFANSIVGISLFNPSIDNGDPIFGAGTIYPTGLDPAGNLDTRGIDFRANDQFSISADGKTLSVHFTANFQGFDQIRVLTSGVPEPASLAVWSVLGSVVGGGSWWRRRKAAAV
jgi:hypothetical protein